MQTAVFEGSFFADPLPAPAPHKVRFLSFIIPTSCDGEATLQELYDGIREQAEKVADDWEILFVDYGKEESTHKVIEGLCEKDPAHVRPLHSESQGRSDALALGYRSARGVFVFTLESDQDNDLKEISPFISKIHDAEPGRGEESGDHWQKILPRGVLRRVVESRHFVSKSRLTMLPV